MNIVYIGDVLPERIFERVSSVGPSTNNVQLRFLKCLFDIAKGKLTVFSRNWGISRLKDHSDMRIQDIAFQSEGGILINVVGFYNTRLLKNASALISLTRSIIRHRKMLSRTSSSEPVLYVVNNPFYGTTLPAFIGKKKKDCIITILCEGLDIRYLQDRPPHLRDHVLHQIHKYLFRHNDGIITFCEKSVQEYAPHVPHISLMHVFEENAFPNIVEPHDNSRKVLLYAGLISPCYGIDAILDAMKLLPVNYHLVICGSGDNRLVERIQAAAQLSSRIEYLGLIPRIDVLHLEQSADLLLLIRKASTISEKYIAQYCQPSKLPEYMLSNTPILATDIPAIPVSARPYLNFTESTPEEIALAVRFLIDGGTGSAQMKAINARCFAQEHCNVNAQNTAMEKFIMRIASIKWEQKYE